MRIGAGGHPDHRTTKEKRIQKALESTRRVAKKIEYVNVDDIFGWWIDDIFAGADADEVVSKIKNPDFPYRFGAKIVKAPRKGDPHRAGPGKVLPTRAKRVR